MDGLWKEFRIADYHGDNFLQEARAVRFSGVDAGSAVILSGFAVLGDVSHVIVPEKTQIFHGQHAKTAIRLDLSSEIACHEGSCRAKVRPLVSGGHGGGSNETLGETS